MPHRATPCCQTMPDHARPCQTVLPSHARAAFAAAVLIAACPVQVASACPASASRPDGHAGARVCRPGPGAHPGAGCAHSPRERRHRSRHAAVPAARDTHSHTPPQHNPPCPRRAHTRHRRFCQVRCRRVYACSCHCCWLLRAGAGAASTQRCASQDLQRSASTTSAVILQRARSDGQHVLAPLRTPIGSARCMNLTHVQWTGRVHHQSQCIGKSERSCQTPLSHHTGVPRAWYGLHCAMRNPAWSTTAVMPSPSVQGHCC